MVRDVAVGTTSPKSNTWLWAWANESIPHRASCPLADVQTFGNEEGISTLMTDSLPDYEHLGWELTAVTARILGAKGAYRCPSDNGFFYVVFSDIASVA
ncbi:MAG TPA: hypothetical protein VFQ91_15010 [Bryobacteraceae bacterium]|nr:hypothetical protein [Bryobacteraceae bacterium]